jgi:hypothetical protein
MSKLTKSLIKVQSELKAPKGQRNKFGNYNYRSAEDILEAVKPLLAANGLTMQISDSVAEVAGIPYIESMVVVSDGETDRVVTAQAGIDPNRKGMDIAQCFGASSSYARKYALNGMFLIDDTKDPDATNDHGKGTTPTPNKAPAKPQLLELTDEIKAKMLSAVASGNKEAVEKALGKYKVTAKVKKEILG